MTNILDVAKLAGVSVSTVSRVMNGGSASMDAQKAVNDAARKLNYQPSCFAKNIRTQKSMTIALMIPDASNLYYTELFKAVEEVALEHDYMVILCDTQNTTESEIIYADKLIRRKVDGLIYCTYKMGQAAQEYFVKLSKKHPVVFVDYAFKKYENISIVATEGLDSSCDAVKFLYHKGKRKIAYINFPEDVQVTQLRYEGYLKGINECGLEAAPSLVYFPDTDETLTSKQIGYQGAKRLLNSNKSIDAIMVAADHLAIGVIKYLKQQGIRIPQDVSVIGFDNNELCEVIEPSLTTIAQPICLLGKKAAEALFAKIESKTDKTVRLFFEGELIQRGST